MAPINNDLKKEKITWTNQKKIFKKAPALHKFWLIGHLKSDNLNKCLSDTNYSSY